MKKSQRVLKFLQETLAEIGQEEFELLSVRDLLDSFIEQTKVGITYSQFHTICKKFKDNPELQEDIEEVDEEIRIVKMDDVELPDGIFDPLPSNKAIDRIISNEGGAMKAAVTMVVGDPGSGKSTILADLLASIQKTNDNVKVLYVQGEQSVIDAAYSHKYMPNTGQVDNIFLSQYANPKRALEKVLEIGYDVVVMDSFADILSKIQSVLNRTTKQIESYLLDLMIKTGEGANDSKKLTSFFCIQQVTKGGDFAGSNTIKHATTAMMEVRIDKKNPDDRYVMFSKNRRCGGLINQKLYFSLDENGEIQYDEERYDRFLESKKQIESEELLRQQNGQMFEDWVNSGLEEEVDDEIDELTEREELI